MSNLSIRAQFRLAIVSQVLARIHRGEPRTSAVTTVASQTHYQLSGVQRRVSSRSIYRWLKAYGERDVAGLERSRMATSQTTVLSGALVQFLEKERVEDEYASIPELIRRARETGVIGPEVDVDRTTVYRLFLRRGISVARRKGASERDSRRFAYPHRMQMVLSDGKHFRAGPDRARRLAMFFIDDCTRAGLHVVVGTSENAELFQRGLYECIRRFGLMKLLFLDNGSAFTALDTATVVENIGVHLIHGEKGYPEGHGKKPWATSCAISMDSPESMRIVDRSSCACSTTCASSTAIAHTKALTAQRLGSASTGTPLHFGSIGIRPSSRASSSSGSSGGCLPTTLSRSHPWRLRCRADTQASAYEFTGACSTAVSRSFTRAG